MSSLMEEVIEAWNSDDAKLPENAVLLTFDDGYIDNFTMAFPLLKEYHMQGSFFIPGKTFAESKLLDVNKIHFILASADIDCLVQDIYEYLDEYRQKVVGEGILSNSELFEKYVGVPEKVFARELYMNRDQIRCMKQDGMFIGVHGYDHYWLGNLSPDEMKRDIDKALETMDEFIDRDNWVLNYPYGSYSQDVLDYIADKGCRLGMTIRVEVADSSKHNRYLLPRLNCNDFPPKSNSYLTIE